MKSKILYQKKYPPLDIKSFTYAHTTIPPIKRPSFDQFLDTLQASTRLIPIPNRTHKKFIALAIKVSKTHELDTVITRHNSHITVDFSFDCGGNMKFLKPIFELADNYSFFTGIKNREITISFDYYTHFVCRNGKIVAP